MTVLVYHAQQGFYSKIWFFLAAVAAATAAAAADDDDVDALNVLASSTSRLTVPPKTARLQRCKFFWGKKLTSYLDLIVLQVCTNVSN